MMTNWSVLCASIEHITRHNTHSRNLVLDSWERPSLKDKTKEHMSTTHSFAAVNYETLNTKKHLARGAFIVIGELF